MFYLILGLGKSGYYAAKYLQSKREKIVLFDDDIKKFQEKNIKDFLENGAEIFNAKKHLKLIVKAILSPGISLNHELVQKLKNLNISIVSEIEFGLSLTKNKKIAITGTNGKSTVCSMIEHVLNYYNISSCTVGNIGYPITKYLLDVKDVQVLIVELSSFQLESYKIKNFDMGLILNIYPHHLDRYENLAAYECAKLSLEQKVKKMYVAKDVFFKFKSKLKNCHVFDVSNFKSENFINQNLAAAFSICENFQISREEFITAIDSFKSLAHRMEKVATIKQVSYFNDSKATNPFAVIQAIERFHKNIVLIAGGYNNSSDFRIWEKSFINKVKVVIAIGQSSRKIYDALSNFIVVFLAKNLNDGFKIATEIAKENDKVLFSPGCQSYDQFRNFEERGDVFKQLVMAQKAREQ
jgi:UDP-N-acetylmuramoylalanine--D-glutamate ligase